MSNIFNSLFSGYGPGGVAQQSVANQAGAQQQAQQMNLLGAQQSQLSNQANQVIHYTGQTPTHIQPSQWVPTGTAYMLPNGNVVMSPADITAEQLDEAKRQYLEGKKAQFLKHPQTHRNAFLDTLRAERVRKDMDDNSMFWGVNRTGLYSTPQPPQVHVEITLEMYEEWDADSLIDAVINEDPQ